MKLGLKPGAGKLFVCLAVLAALCGLLGMVNPGPASALDVPGLHEGYITTVAGSGDGSYSGDGVPATSAKIGLTEKIAVDSDGNLFIAYKDGYRVFEVAAKDGTQYGINMTAGNIYTVAGKGISGYSGDNGPATDAHIDNVECLAVDSAGNLYIGGGYRVRMVNPNGIITTVVGDGIPPTTSPDTFGDNGPATSARISPAAVAVDGDGNLYIASINRIRKVDPSTGIITTSAQPGFNAVGMAVDSDGKLYISCDANHRVYRVDPGGAITMAGNGTAGYSGDGGPATSAQLNLSQKSGLAVDSAGNLYIADTNNHRVRYVQIAPEAEPELATLTLSGSPALYYTGTPLTFDLGELTLAGADQYGAAFDLTGQTVTWAVYSGPATLSGSILTITGSDMVSVTASVYGVTSNILSLTVASPPALIADTTDNIVGQDVELTFTDDPAWREAISEVRVDGTALNPSAYSKTRGLITIKKHIFTKAKDYDIVIKASGYADAQVTQTLFALTITGDGVTTPVKLSPAQLQQMQQYQHIYSTINTWPTKKWYVGSGVKLRDLLASAGIKDEATLIKFTASDSYTVTMTVQELLKDQRYFFPHFMDNGSAGHIPGSPEDAEEVEPILALKSEASNNFDDMNSQNALLLMIGQRAVTEQTNDLYCKYVNKIEVFTTAPEKWDNPVASPASGSVSPGTMIALSNDHMDNDKIYYTTDGSTPTVNSQMYNWIAHRWWGSRSDVLDTINHPIEIKNNTTIKAVTIGPGKADSEVVTFEYRVSGTATAPPALTADTTGNTVGLAVELTFTDDATWRCAITDITVNGNSIAGQYSVTAGTITINAGVFTGAGDYTVVVKAAGYTDATVTQHMVNSGSASDTTAPIWIDGSLTASKVSRNSLTLTWSGASDDIGVTGYKVYQGTTLLTATPVTGTSYNVTGLSAGTQYNFTVQAVDAAGNESTDGPSATVTTSTYTSSDDGDSATTTPTAVTSTTGTAIVTPGVGGTISLGSEATVQIPANALMGTSAVVVKVQKVTVPPEIPAGFKLAGSVYEFSVGGQTAYSFARSVTLTLTFDSTALEQGETPAIYYYDQTQAKWINLGGTVSGNTVTVQVDHFTKYAVMAVKKTAGEPAVEKPSAALTDITGHWAQANINKLVALGAISGYPDGSFKPDNTITRAEFATMLVKTFKLTSQGGKVFADTANHWAKDYIATAASYGIVNGYDANTFGPDDLITREQMAVMIVKAAKVKATAAEITFTDSSAISAWAGEAVAAAVQNGIMKGYPDGTFGPRRNATRAEAVTVIANALK